MTYTYRQQLHLVIQASSGQIEISALSGLQGATSLANSLDSSLTLCNGFSADFLADEDMLLDDVLLPDEDLLDLAPEEAIMKAPEKPPLGLKLTKSASLVELINAELGRSHSAPLSVA